MSNQIKTWKLKYCRFTATTAAPHPPTLDIFNLINTTQIKKNSTNFSKPLAFIWFKCNQKWHNFTTQHSTLSFLVVQMALEQPQQGFYFTTRKPKCRIPIPSNLILLPTIQILRSLSQSLNTIKTKNPI